MQNKKNFSKKKKIVSSYFRLLCWCNFIQKKIEPYHASIPHKSPFCAHLYAFFPQKPFKQEGGSGTKCPSIDMEKKNSQLSNLLQSVFVLENPTHWGLETAVCPIFAKPVLDIFTVCLLVPRINFSHTKQGYLCPKIKITCYWNLI